MDIETIDINVLKPHPRNYREHPKDELDHIKESIQRNGIYRPIVIAKDNTILAGHGVVTAARELGIAKIPTVRLPLAPDSPKAMKVLIGDNEIQHLVHVDDYALAEILKEIKDSAGEDLLGTGYDEMMLANLAFISRPQSDFEEIADAEQWAGMPEYQIKRKPLEIVVHFGSVEDREKFGKLIGLELPPDTKTTGTWFPVRYENDSQAHRFVEVAQVDAQIPTEPPTPQQSPGEQE